MKKKNIYKSNFATENTVDSLSYSLHCILFVLILTLSIDISHAQPSQLNKYFVLIENGDLHGLKASDLPVQK